MELHEKALTPSIKNKREVEIVILEEGPGNKARNCWYGPEALETGKDIFRGAQVYANHPSKTQTEDLPERDIRELIGRIKETYLVMGENGKRQLRGVLKILEGEQYDWALSLIHESIEAKKEGYPPVAQVSIHADGDVEKRLVENKYYNYVTRIKSAVSVDVVTKGGVKNAGFTKFIESYFGGLGMDRTQERLAQIRNKLAGALNAEDVSFLESYDEEHGNDDDSVILLEDDAGNEYEFEPVFVLEDGSFANEAGEVVEPDEIVAADEDGNVFSADEVYEMVAPELDDAADYETDENDGEAFIEDPEEYDDGGEEYDEGYDDDGYDEDYDEDGDYPVGPEIPENYEEDVPISELATQYPEIANEIDQEEMGMAESDRDIDIVNLKFENKLLTRRIIAETKLAESGMAEFIDINELIGKTPEGMDRLIESRANMIEGIIGLVEAQRPAPMQFTESARISSGPSLKEVGRRILRSAIMPR